jgi:hypothetical protein
MTENAAHPQMLLAASLLQLPHFYGLEVIYDNMIDIFLLFLVLLISAHCVKPLEQ